MSLKLTYRFAKGEYSKAMAEIYRPISEAGTSAIREAATRAKLDGREQIAAAGFSRRFQNALRADVYPKRGASANAAALIYHKVPYSEVFETGATIQGQPMMWVPLAGLPRKLGGKRLTAERFATTVGDLFTLRRPGKNPLLLANMRVSKREAEAGPPYRIRMSALVRGSQQGRGVMVRVPVFVGVDTVKIAKRLNIYSSVAKAVDDLPDLYLKHLRPDA